MFAYKFSFCTIFIDHNVFNLLLCGMSTIMIVLDICRIIIFYILIRGII